MIVVRYFWWVVVFHIVTVHKQAPWHFFIGLLVTPLHFLVCLSAKPDIRREAVRVGAHAVVAAWRENTLPPAPAFIRKRFYEFAEETP